MNEHLEPDPLDELRAADPLADRLSSASLARIRARVQEATTVEEGRTSDRSKRPGWRAWGAGLATAGVAAVVVAGLVVSRGGAPSLTPGPSAGTGMASCVEQYSLETLKHRSFAFEGTVSSISGDEVTFAVNESYIGAESATVTLTAMGMTGTAITSAGGANLSVGGRYLVAGDDHFVWACGFTQPYDPGVAAQWKQASGR